jgi:hypothetical protein
MENGVVSIGGYGYNAKPPVELRFYARLAEGASDVQLEVFWEKRAVCALHPWRLGPSSTRRPVRGVRQALRSATIPYREIMSKERKLCRR